MTQGYVHYTAKVWAPRRKLCQHPKPRLRQAHGSVRFFYFHSSHFFFSKTGCGKLMARYLQFLGKFDLIKSALYIHTEKKPTHCVSQRVGQQVQKLINVWLSASCEQRQQTPSQASLAAHYEIRHCSKARAALLIARRGASNEQGNQSTRATSSTTLLESPFCSPAKNWEIRGGSELGSSHLRTTPARMRADGIHGVRVMRRHPLSDSPKTKSHAPGGRGFYLAKSDFSVPSMAGHSCAGTILNSSAFFESFNTSMG